MLGPDFKNIYKVHAFRPIQAIGGGCVMANMKESEAFGKITQLIQKILQVILFTLVMAVLLAFWASRWRVFSPNGPW